MLFRSSWAVQGLALHGLDLCPDNSCLPSNLFIAEPAQDVLLFKVTTLLTWLNVVLEVCHREVWKEREIRNYIPYMKFCCQELDIVIILIMSQPLLGLW